jgi:hypothetical protein
MTDQSLLRGVIARVARMVESPLSSVRRVESGLDIEGIGNSCSEGDD